MRINNEGYVERKDISYKPAGTKSNYRDWWFIRCHTNNNSGMISIKQPIFFNNKFVGKKVRLKIEFIDNIDLVRKEKRDRKAELRKEYMKGYSKGKKALLSKIKQLENKINELETWIDIARGLD